MSDRSPFALSAVAAAAIVLVLAADGPRVTLLCTVAGAAILITRVRFAAHVATALLAACALMAMAGQGPASDKRERTTPAAAMHDGHHRHTRER